MTTSLKVAEVKQFKPVQLELPLIDQMGKPRPDGCRSALLNFMLPHSFSSGIPGLDACLCRCEDCRAKGSGVWWYSSYMRDRILSRKSIMRTASADGESLRDSE